MKPCTNALYDSLISRCDSAAIVPKTRELLPEPETPVNTVSRRLGSTTLMSLRLLTRAPWTRISACASAFVDTHHRFGHAHRLLGALALEADLEDALRAALD